MTVLAAVVMLACLAAFVFWTAKSWRMSETELRERFGRAESNIGFTSATGRAPMGWLLVGTLGVLMAMAILALDFTDSLGLIVVAAALFVAWLLSIVLATCASFLGRPSFLVHPHLRSDPSWRKGRRRRERSQA
jgi:hypothetical protein